MSLTRVLLISKDGQFKFCSQSDRHGRINKRQSEECEHEFGIEIICFNKLSKSPRPSKSPRLTGGVVLHLH